MDIRGILSVGGIILMGELEGVINGQQPVPDKQTSSSHVDPATPQSGSHVDPFAPTHITPTDSKVRYMAPLVGQTIGGVQIDRLIKSGGMSDVYHGVISDKEVAVKVLKKEHLGSPQIVRRFLEDAKITARLKHPNIIETIRYSEDNADVPYIVYDFILNNLATTALLPEENARILLDIARALNYAHSADGTQVIHRDVKPENVQVALNPLRAYLIDFGLGKIIEEGKEGVTIAKDFLGTPAFMSPEQAADAKDVTPATDVYSWACTAYAVLSGKGPRERTTGASDPMDVIQMRMNPQVMHDLWLNEAIDARVSELTGKLNSVPDEKKSRIRDVLDKMSRVSYDFENLVMQVLCAKKPEERPSFSMIIPKLESLIEQNMIKQRELVEAEKSARDGLVRALRSGVQERRDEFANAKDAAQKAQKQYVLGCTIARLADAVRGDEQKQLREETLALFNELYSAADVAARNNQPIPGISVQAIADEKSWAASSIILEQERRNHFEKRVLEQRYKSAFGSVMAAFGKNEFGQAAVLYKDIDPAKVPDSLKRLYEKLNSRLEHIVSSIIDEGSRLLDSNLDGAEKSHGLAKQIADVLPASSASKKAVAGFYQVLQAEQKIGQYKSAESEKDFYTMLKRAQEIEALLKNDFPADRLDKYKSWAEKVLKDLEPKSVDIGLCEQFINGAGKLIKTLESESAEDAVLEEKIKYLPPDVIQKYKTAIDEIGRKSAMLNRENIGPKYDELKEYLSVIREDLEAAEKKQTIREPKVSYAERLKAISWLVNYYHGRGDDPNLSLYLRMSRAWSSRWLNEIKPK